MSSRRTKKWVVKSSYKGVPKLEDLEIVEEELPPLKDGGRVPFVSFKNIWLSVRGWSVTKTDFRFVGRISVSGSISIG